MTSQDNAGEYFCGRSTYGFPNIVDCHPLLESFANYQDNILRVFDEEQMRVNEQGSWPGVTGIVGAAHLDRVVQVPRYYTLDSCNFALMSYAYGPGSVTALGGTSWAKVNARGNFMMTKCLLNGPLGSGGVVAVPSTGQPSQSVLSLFMWQSGSLFDTILNSFSNSPAAMIPAPGDGFASNWTSVNTTGVPPNMLAAFQAALANTSEGKS
ncbi:hypothetical protein IMSHALPRED_009868 [Imshaugia aleurites]|uniref:Uncharacterized protein n=1 Tax=Imshaugia aleurites TaxID=172621 RepID=A0A8H3INV5_9LECA|nr:hypothetical protein IMSHALPRED_009868 [Imshaugia aleurites]